MLEVLFVSLLTTQVPEPKACVVAKVAVMDDVCAFAGWHCFETRDCGDGKPEWIDQGCASGSTECSE
jgi:hypothetical protein